MKFLIFNIIVFLSLGYLLTSKPDENFNNWFGSTKERISQISKEEVISTIKKATSKDNNEEIQKISKHEDMDEKKIKNSNVQDEPKIFKSPYSDVKKIKVENLTKKNNELEKVKFDKKENYQTSDDKSSQENIILDKKKFDVEKLIKQVIAEKKVNDSNLKTKKENKSEFKNSENKIDYINNKSSKNSFKENRYMSNLERENALAELIIDMELYHLSTLKD